MIECIKKFDSKNKYNYIKDNKEVLSSVWSEFPFIWEDEYNLGIIKKDEYHYNIIKENGEFLFEDWKEEIHPFFEGFAEIKDCGKHNFIDKNGKILFSQWFNDANMFSEGFAPVQVKGKWNLIDKNGNYLLKEWLQYSIFPLSNGISQIMENPKKYNFINKDGKILSDEWFGAVTNFYKYDVAAVRKVIDGKVKSNIINKDGKLLSEEWFDMVGWPEHELIRVKLNEKWNYIKLDGTFISKDWFDEDPGEFRDKITNVMVNGEEVCINRNGEITKQ